MLSSVIECTWMALEWRTPNRHAKTKDENLLSSSTQESHTKVLANAADEVCNFNQCTRRNGYRENTHILCRLGKNCTVYFRFPFLLTFHSNSCSFSSFFLLLGCCFFSQPSHLFSFLFFAFITTYKNHGVSTTADQDTVTDFFLLLSILYCSVVREKKESKFNLFNKMIKELTDVMRRTLGCGFFYVH